MTIESRQARREKVAEIQREKPDLSPIISHFTKFKSGSETAQYLFPLAGFVESAAIHADNIQGDSVMMRVKTFVGGLTQESSFYVGHKGVTKELIGPVSAGDRVEIGAAAECGDVWVTLLWRARR